MEQHNKISNERYFKCDGCGKTITKMSSSLKVIGCGYCKGYFSIELTKDEIVEIIKEWGYSKREINDFFKN
jgi:transcription elongation factor Elf1